MYTTTSISIKNYYKYTKYTTYMLSWLIQRIFRYYFYYYKNRKYDFLYFNSHHHSRITETFPIYFPDRHATLCSRFSFISCSNFKVNGLGKGVVDLYGLFFVATTKQQPCEALLMIWKTILNF